MEIVPTQVVLTHPKTWSKNETNEVADAIGVYFAKTGFDYIVIAQKVSSSEEFISIEKLGGGNFSDDAENAPRADVLPTQRNACSRAAEIINRALLRGLTPTKAAAELREYYDKELAPIAQRMAEMMHQQQQ